MEGQSVTHVEPIVEDEQSSFGSNTDLEQTNA